MEHLMPILDSKKYPICFLEICWTVTMMAVISKPSQTFSFKEVNALDVKQKQKQEKSNSPKITQTA